ncbi:YajD family HNH nuclease [Motiliproteus sp. SC1-56]|uniref:YajD family HNH nuclease n=1 Tax=Motiliproteus sp. SC1-56 TaxID=2799565 RepID=UPI00351CB0AC
MTAPKRPDPARLKRITEAAVSARNDREAGYRARALKLYPWICGRCGREFNRLNLSELTVHHRDHNHDNNPADGSNWELLCLYCHDNEHSRYEDTARYSGDNHGGQGPAPATSRPFADLKALLDGEGLDKDKP